MAKTAAEPALLVATPEYYHANRAFGFWALPNVRQPPGGRSEDQLDSAFDFYNKEVDPARWYGFWDYGDMMRHTTRWPSVEIRHRGWAWNTPSCGPITGCGTTSCARAGPTPSVWPRP